MVASFVSSTYLIDNHEGEYSMSCILITLPAITCSETSNVTNAVAIILILLSYYYLWYTRHALTILLDLLSILRVLARSEHRIVTFIRSHRHLSLDKTS